MNYLFEYKIDCNFEGRGINPTWISPTDCGYFYNVINYTYVGMRLSPKVKVPDAVLALTRATLITRNKIAGICMKTLPDGTLEQMTDQEIEDITNAFCDLRNIA